MTDAGMTDAGMTDAAMIDAGTTDGGPPPDPRDAVRLSDAATFVADGGEVRIVGRAYYQDGLRRPSRLTPGRGEVYFALWVPRSTYLDVYTAEAEGPTRVFTEAEASGPSVALLRLEVDGDRGTFSVPEDALLAMVDLGPFGELAAGGPHPTLPANLVPEYGAEMVLRLSLPLAASDPTEETTVLLVRAPGDGSPASVLLVSGLGPASPPEASVGVCAAACVAGQGVSATNTGPECWCNSVRFTESGVVVVGSRAPVAGTVDPQPRTRVAYVDPTTGSVATSTIQDLCFVAIDATTGAPVLSETCEDLWFPPPPPGDVTPFDGPVATILPLVEADELSDAVFLQARTDLGYDGPSGPGRVASGDLIGLQVGPCFTPVPPIVSNPAPYCWWTTSYQPPMTSPAVVVPIETRGSGTAPHVLEASPMAATLQLRNLLTDDVSLELAIGGPQPWCEIEPAAMTLERLRVSAVSAELGEVEPRLRVVAVLSDPAGRTGVWVGEVPEGMRGRARLHYVPDGAEGCPAEGSFLPVGTGEADRGDGTAPVFVYARAEETTPGEAGWEYRLVSVVLEPVGMDGEPMEESPTIPSVTQPLTLRGIEKKDIWRGMVGAMQGSLDDLLEAHFGFTLLAGADLVDTEGSSARERLMRRWSGVVDPSADVCAMNKAELIDAIAKGSKLNRPSM